MKKNLFPIVILLGFLPFFPLQAIAQRMDAKPQGTAIAELAHLENQFGARGLRFTENKGQVADLNGQLRPDILFTAQNEGVQLFLTAKGKDDNCNGIADIVCSGSNWSWVTEIAPGSVMDMVTLPSGKSIVVGSFTNFQVAGIGVPSDYFLLRIDSNGQIAGGIQKGPDNLSIGLHVGIDDSQNIYVFGKPFTPQTDYYFLKKYNPEGVLQWTRKLHIPNSISTEWMYEGAAGMDVQHGRIALTGNYFKQLSVFALHENVIENKLGDNSCDPDFWPDEDDPPCPLKNDCFVLSFETNGNLAFSQSFGSPVVVGKFQDQIGYYTREDFNDFGWDVAIDKDLNTFLMGSFSNEGNSVHFGSIHYTDWWNNILIKLNAIGEPQWAKPAEGYYFPEPDDVSSSYFPNKLNVDGSGNVFVANLADNMGRFDYKISMYNGSGDLTKSFTISPKNISDFEVSEDPFAWLVDLKGVIYFSAKISYYDEGDNWQEKQILQKIAPEGHVQWETNSLLPGLSRFLGIDADENIYLSTSNAIGKWIQTTWFKDADNDGYSDGTKLIQETSPDFYKRACDLISITGDCNDNNADINPGATEVCGNGIDDNCNGSTDEGCGTGLITWYRDADGDGFGRNVGAKLSATQPRGYVAVSGDCHDGDPTIYPGAPELPDGKDNNCNGQVDEGLDCVRTWYQDKDGDGYGRRPNSKQSCIQPPRYVDNADDCHDGDPGIYPGAPEICDGKDNDCDGIKDEGCIMLTSKEEANDLHPKAMEPVGELAVRVWPNPAPSEVMVTLDDFARDRKVELVLLTADGRSLKALTILPFAKGQQVRLDVRQLPVGLYLIKLQQGNTVLTKRVVVRR